MKKAKLIGLLGATSLVLVIAIMPAFSAPMTSATYSIPSLTISSGGSNGLQSTTYKLQDIKGQAVIGSGASTTYGIGLGGVYGTLGGGGVEAFGGDVGLIQNTQIFRNTTAPGSNLKLTWTYRAGSGVTQADIWRLSGPSANYSEVVSWTKIFTTPAGVTEYLDTLSGPPVVGDGENAYYRVVPAGRASDQIFTYENNARTAAKVDVQLTSGGSKIVAIPVYAGSIADIMSGQVGNDEFYFYPKSEGGGLDAKRYVDDRLNAATFIVSPGVGFWVENKSGNEHKLTFVGILETLGEREITRIDITGNTAPYPSSFLALRAYLGDKIFPPATTGGLNAYVHGADGWIVRDRNLTLLNTTDGCWYEHSATRYWRIDLRGGVSIKDRF